MNSPQIPDQVFIGAANRLVPWVLRTTGRRHVALAVAGGVVLGIASILPDQYRDYQMAQVAAFVVAVAGLTVLIGLSGQISIGNGAFMAVGGYVAALLFMRLNWPLIAILIMSTLAAAAVGAVFGVAAARLRGP